MYLVMAITDRKDDRDTDPNMCVCPRRQEDDNKECNTAAIYTLGLWATYHNIICKQYL